MYRVDHTWPDGGVAAHAHLGFEPDGVRCWNIYTEDEDQLVTCGRLCALSRAHGPGRKIVLSPRWLHHEDTVWKDSLYEL